MTGIPDPLHQLLEALPDVALSAGGASMDHTSWIFIGIPIFVNLAVFAYYFGGLAQRIRILESDFEKMVSTYTRVDDRTHGLAVVMGKIETQMDTLCAQQFRDHSDCPLAPSVARRRPIRLDDTSATTA